MKGGSILQVVIAGDHGGLALKEEIITYLKSAGVCFQDYGVCNSESVDYPEVVLPAVEAVAAGRFDRALLVCGTGIGVSIVANKVPGIRAALCADTYSARYTRLHNDTNVLALGGRVTGPGLALDIVKIWLATDFEGGRHERRLQQIKAIEDKYALRRNG